LLCLDTILVADAWVGSASIRVRRLVVAARRRLGHGGTARSAPALSVLMVLVEIVPLKQLLRCRIHDNIHIFFNCLGVLPFLVIYVILIEIDLVRAGKIRRSQRALNEPVPVKVIEPGVLLCLMVSIVAEPLVGLPT